MGDIKTVGVIGAGQMGSGIAHVCALAGYEVRLNDLSRERIDGMLAGKFAEVGAFISNPRQ